MTVLEQLEKAAMAMNSADLWYGHGTDNAWDEAVHLLCHVKHWPPNVDDAVLTQQLTAAESTDFQRLVERRINERIPAAYLTGKTWFAGLEFNVSTAVLVPRSPIAELLSYAFRPWLSDDPSTVLDLCTGSGCIGISIAHYFEQSNVIISDVSSEALEVANGNILKHNLKPRVQMIQSDLFEDITGRFGLIVSNPPYVDADDMASLPEEYLNEPQIGLVGGEDGLDLVIRILAEATDYLEENGLLIVEVGNSFEALENLFPQVPFIWPEFDEGGHGVFILEAAVLQRFRESFRQEAYNRQQLK